MYTLGPAHPEILAGSSPRGGARLLGVSRAPQGWSRAFWGGAGLSSQNSARLLFGLLAGTWAPATWPDWLCRICSPQPPYPP
jgi:hypothetical protein